MQPVCQAPRAFAPKIRSFVVVRPAGAEGRDAEIFHGVEILYACSTQTRMMLAVGPGNAGEAWFEAAHARLRTARGCRQRPLGLLMLNT